MIMMKMFEMTSVHLLLRMNLIPLPYIRCFLSDGGLETSLHMWRLAALAYPSLLFPFAAPAVNTTGVGDADFHNRGGMQQQQQPAEVSIGRIKGVHWVTSEQHFILWSSLWRMLDAHLVTPPTEPDSKINIPPPPGTRFDKAEIPRPPLELMSADEVCFSLPHKHTPITRVFLIRAWILALEQMHVLCRLLIKYCVVTVCHVRLKLIHVCAVDRFDLARFVDFL
jgi:hypothetical protein